MSASDVIQFPGQLGPPTYGVIRCAQSTCRIIVSGPGDQVGVWLAVYPGPLADDGRGWALMDASGGTVMASAK